MTDDKSAFIPGTDGVCMGHRYGLYMDGSATFLGVTRIVCAILSHFVFTSHSELRFSAYSSKLNFHTAKEVFYKNIN